jgi:hypothetical protein
MAVILSTGTSVEDIAPLAECPKLKTLYLDGTKVRHCVRAYLLSIAANYAQQTTRCCAQGLAIISGEGRYLLIVGGVYPGDDGDGLSTSRMSVA